MFCEHLWLNSSYYWFSKGSTSHSNLKPQLFECQAAAVKILTPLELTQRRKKKKLHQSPLSWISNITFNTLCSISVLDTYMLTSDNSTLTVQKFYTEGYKYFVHQGNDFGDNIWFLWDASWSYNHHLLGQKIHNIFIVTPSKSTVNLSVQRCIHVNFNLFH